MRIEPEWIATAFMILLLIVFLSMQYGPQFATKKNASEISGKETGLEFLVQQNFSGYPADDLLEKVNETTAPSPASPP